VFCPHLIFQILTNHQDVTQAMGQSATWLVPLLSLTAAVFMLESYFTGVKDGATLRNGSILSFCVGFFPLVCLAIHRHSGDLLWGALTAYMGVMLVFLTYQLINQHGALLFGDGRSGEQSPRIRRSPTEKQASS
jgi:MATE family multidrug resistance protein